MWPHFVSVVHNRVGFNYRIYHFNLEIGDRGKEQIVDGRWNNSISMVPSRTHHYRWCKQLVYDGIAFMCPFNVQFQIVPTASARWDRFQESFQCANWRWWRLWVEKMLYSSSRGLTVKAATSSNSWTVSWWPKCFLLMFYQHVNPLALIYLSNYFAFYSNNKFWIFHKKFSNSSMYFSNWRWCLLEWVGRHLKPPFHISHNIFQI